MPTDSNMYHYISLFKTPNVFMAPTICYLHICLIRKITHILIKLIQYYSLILRLYYELPEKSNITLYLTFGVADVEHYSVNYFSDSLAGAVTV